MRKKLKVALVLVPVLVLALSVPLGYAREYGKQGGHCGYHKGLEQKFFHKAHFILKNQGELDLSDKQIEEIRALKLETKKELIMRKAEIETIKVDIKANLYQDAIDTEVTNKLVDEKYELKKEKAKSLVKAFAALKNTLTEGQKKELKNLWRKDKKQ